MQSTKLAMIGVLGLASLGLGSLAAQAAPPAPGTLDTMTTAAREGKAENVAYRRCWWHHGHRHCRGYGYGGYGYRGYGYRGYYGPLYPEAYRTGSRRWWQEMDREDRGGRGRP
jgi:hypothetical protein